MNADLTDQMLSLSAARTQHSVQIALAKKQQEMDQSLLGMIDQAVRSAPAPAGQGLKVDKTA